MTSPSENVQPESTNRLIDNIIVGGGEMGALIRAFDWSSTALGPIETWPQSLKSAISILLPSKAQICLFWGKDLTTLYNDAYRPVVGVKHPRVLGVPAWECWSEIWEDVLDGLFQEVVKTGEAFWAQDYPFFLQRYGFPEETYFDVSYDPVRDETGEVGGVFCIVNETTNRVLGGRRLRILHDLGERTAEGKTPEEACQNAVQIFAHNLADIPFSLLYLLDEDRQEARLVGGSEIDSGTPFAPCVIDLNDPSHSAWSLATVFSTGQAVTLTDLGSRFEQLPAGPWTEPPHTAVVLPLPASGSSQFMGFLILGISSRLVLDEGYFGFARLVAGQVATAISNARAYAEERRRAEALAELDRAKTEFFSNVSHEFRTPLTLLLGPLDAMLEQDDQNTLLPHQRETLEVARRNALRLLKLVNMVLDFSRIQSNRIQASFEPTDLATLTMNLASVFRSAIERVGLRLIVDCPPSTTPVYIDHEMWEKIVLNLLSNAFKFTFDGEINLSMRWLPEHVELKVSDTGVGIEADELPNIFERFHRVRGVRARTHEGSGIGLTLVQELVHIHHGTIEVSSEVNKGTTFTIQIPLGTAHLPSEQVRPARTISSASANAVSYVEEALRWDSDGVEENGTLDALLKSDAGSVDNAYILVVDDNADMRDYLRRILEQRYIVETVKDGKAALESIQRRLPHLVVTDVMMPLMDGFVLLQQLRADPNTQTLPILLLSARSGEDARVEGLEAGADDYLVKPFSARELLARVNAQLAMAQLRQNLLIKERNARTEAENANLLKLKFLSMVSHELRTPLASIKGFATTLLADDVSFKPEEQRQFASIINEEADKLTDLVDHLLDLSRLQAGTLRIEIVPTTLQTIVDSALVELQQLTTNHELIIEILPATVKADPQRIAQVMVNLVNNSVKFSPPGTKIEVRTHPLETAIQIDVSDEGAGIPIENRESVFEAFRQLEISSTSKQKGAGLGLAICKGIIEAHQGQIWIQERSRPGTTISFTLPIM